MTDLSNLYFIDIETTGLKANDGHRPWEIAIVDINGDTLLHRMWKPKQEVMAKADAMALKIGKFYQRINDPSTTPQRQDNESYVASLVAGIFGSGATICGAAVHFDALMLDVWLRENGQVGCWSHRLLDIESYVAGATGHRLPASLGDTATRAEVTYESDQKHTALYDAQLARECYLAVASIKLPHVGDMMQPKMPTPPPMEGSDG